MSMPPPPIRPGTTPECRAVTKILGRLGDKWTIMVVTMLMGGPVRFNELRRSIGGISQQMLTRTLRSLESDGLVCRTVHPTIPPQVEYDLTGLGHSLSVPLTQLAGWVMENMPELQRNRAGAEAAEPA